MPRCDAPPRFARVDARYFSDAHRLKDWRRKKRAARAKAPQVPIEQPHDAVPEQEGYVAEYQQMLALVREITHLKERLIIDPRDDEARARLRELRSRLEGP